MSFKESFTLHGEHLVKKIKELMTFPLTIGVAGALFAPILAAVGALAALIGECTITVEREATEPPHEDAPANGSTGAAPAAE